MIWLSNLATAIFGFFSAKQATKTEEVQGDNDKTLQGTAQIELQQQQATITSNLTGYHNIFANFGIALIWASCGICIFHDFVIVKIAGDFGFHLSCMTSEQVMNLVYTLLGNGVLHVAKNWKQG